MHSQVGKISFGDRKPLLRSKNAKAVGSTKIICKYCGKPYMAYKKGRTHCRSDDCRSKEIKQQLESLGYFVESFCRNKIEAEIELRFPGNDKLSSDAKICSISNLKDDTKIQGADVEAGIDLPELIDYFRPILWKGVKGNFIIETLRNGTINPKIINETFTEISNPVIVGNNLIINGSA